MYATLITEFFKATNTVASKFDSPEIRIKKKEVMARYEEWQRRKSHFEKAAVEFSDITRSDELFGLADYAQKAKEEYMQAMIVFAKEIK